MNLKNALAIIWPICNYTMYVVTWDLSMPFDRDNLCNHFKTSRHYLP